MADLGADVIKIERAGAGDDTRTWGPPYLKGKDGKDTRESGYFLSVNRGKRSVELDLSSAKDQDVVKALAKRSDIVLENFKVGTLPRYGLGYEQLAAVNPKIIYCSITGFGQTGPYRDNSAYDFMIQGMGGLMSITGERDDAPGGGPQKVGVPIVDIMTGMYATIACLAALARRGETGQGEYIDLAMLDVQASFLANQAQNYLASGKAPKRSGNRHPNIQPQDVFPVRNGHIVLACGNDGQYRKLCEAMGKPELADDPRFADNKSRVVNLAILHPIISECLLTRDLKDWLQDLEARGVPCGPINTIPMVFEDPQIKHRKMLRELPHPAAGTVKQVVSPMNFKNAPLSFDRPPPMLGEHTKDVLRELGLPVDETAKTA
jgi:crotonobetainyl-CoA:carnitine CoA-transferase CaiB-like acyl-CoA transferase